MLNSRRFGWAMFTAAMVLVASIGICQQPGGFTSPGHLRPPTNPRPHLGSTGYRGPPLSTALPTSGPYDRGLVTTGPSATGTSPYAPSMSRSFVPSRHTGASYKSQFERQYTTPGPLISGGDMARVAMYRGVYGNLRF